MLKLFRTACPKRIPKGKRICWKICFLLEENQPGSSAEHSLRLSMSSAEQRP